MSSNPCGCDAEANWTCLVHQAIDAAKSGGPVQVLTRPTQELTRPTNPRIGDQPLPVKNDSPCIQDMVIRDIESRKTLGLQRYGTLLQPFNGRDALRDAYEEALDLAQYLRQAIEERNQLGDPGRPE